VRDENIGLDQIQTEWSILSYSAKQLNEKRVDFEYTGGRGADKVRDDKPLLKKLWAVLDSADIIVAQNGREFDLKKINARMTMYGMRPYSPVRVIDTMLSARRHFGFTSNRLAWLSKHLTDTPKSTHKQFPGFELWLECLKDSPKAWREMRKYNAQDVIATEALYLRLRPWIEGHPNVVTYSDSEEIACPKCGSTELISNGLRTNQTGRYRRFQCQGCGGWAFERAAASGRRPTLLGN
jgi:uncharacterized protein YprB with RNaseH-like and TPR domain